MLRYSVLFETVRISSECIFFIELLYRILTDFHYFECVETASEFSGAHGRVCGVTLQRDPGDFSFNAASVSVAGVRGFICIYRPHLHLVFFQG